MSESSHPVLSWLLAGDPAIRWQVFRDLLDCPAAAVAREQTRVAHEGWGRRLLDRQGPDGRWAGLYTPKWTSATYTLLLLKALGLPHANRAAKRGATALLDEGLYRDNGINFWQKSIHSSETCVTGMVLAITALFARRDVRVENLVQNLLTEQMPDGGWNCRRFLGARHSSVHTTISVLEGLLEYEISGGSQAGRTREARQCAHEFLGAHRLFRSHRTGAVIDARMTRFSFPPQWHYDVLRGLDYLRAAGATKDPRFGEAIEVVKERQAGNGRWRLQNVHPGRYHFALEQAGEPSRWNTLRALRVLRWWEGSDVPDGDYGDDTTVPVI